MGSQVRWKIQVSKAGHNNWIDREDLCYSGWFDGGYDSSPTPGLIDDYKKAVDDYGWLDVRLVQETRKFTSEVLMSHINPVEQ